MPNKILLEVLPVFILYCKKQAHNTLSWESVVSNVNIRYTLFCCGYVHKVYIFHDIFWLKEWLQLLYLNPPVVINTAGQLCSTYLNK